MLRAPSAASTSLVARPRQALSPFLPPQPSHLLWRPRADLDRCYEAVRHAPLHRIHTFLASSDIHLEHKLHISRAVCIERAVVAVKHAKAM